MDEYVQEFRRLDYEVIKVRKLPLNLCNNYDCRNENSGKDFPDISQILTKRQEEESHLKEIAQTHKDMLQVCAEISKNMKSCEEDIRTLINKVPPAALLKLKEEFPDIVKSDNFLQIP